MHLRDHRLLSAQAVAEELGVTERTVRRWIESGRLQAEKRGRCFQIRLDEAKALTPDRSLGARAREDSRRLGAQVEELDALRRAVDAAREEAATVKGRYEELAERAARIEAELNFERRRAISLELQLEACGVKAA
jgi:excisionase family DNA binding protein